MPPPTSLAELDPIQEEMCVGGLKLLPAQTKPPSIKTLKSASFEAGQFTSSTSILTVPPVLFVIVQEIVLPLREKPPIVIRLHTSGVAVWVGEGGSVAVGVRLGVEVLVRVGIDVGVLVEVGVGVRLLMGEELATRDASSVLAGVAEGVREGVAVLTAVVPAVAVLVSAAAVFSTSAMGVRYAGSSEPPDSSKSTCSVAAIAVWTCSSDMPEPAAAATAVESESTVAFQSTVGLGVNVAVPPAPAAPVLNERESTHSRVSTTSAASAT